MKLNKIIGYPSALLLFIVMISSCKKKFLDREPYGGLPIAFRRDASFGGYNSTGTALLDDILLERRKELAFEGHRYWDIARYNQDVVRIDLAGNYPGVPLIIPADNFRRILPIPQSELDANPNIRGQQNVGY